MSGIQITDFYSVFKWSGIQGLDSPSIIITAFLSSFFMLATKKIEI